MKAILVSPIKTKQSKSNLTCKEQGRIRCSLPSSLPLCCHSVSSTGLSFVPFLVLHKTMELKERMPYEHPGYFSHMV